MLCLVISSVNLCVSSHSVAPAYLVKLFSSFIVIDLLISTLEVCHQWLQARVKVEQVTIRSKIHRAPLDKMEVA